MKLVDSSLRELLHYRASIKCSGLFPVKIIASVNLDMLAFILIFFPL